MSCRAKNYCAPPETFDSQTPERSRERPQPKATIRLSPLISDVVSVPPAHLPIGRWKLPWFWIPRFIIRQAATLIKTKDQTRNRKGARHKIMTGPKTRRH